PLPAAPPDWCRHALPFRGPVDGRRNEMEPTMRTSPPESPDALAVAWHALPQDAICTQLKTGTEGLSAAEAAQRLRQHGPNLLPEAVSRSVWKRLLTQFNNALILFLLASAVIAGMLGHAVDAAVIVAVVLVNAIVGFVQEGRAEQALAA